jgi:putative SOS response-associated peptidase YedK
MCGRYAFFSDPEDVADLFEVAPPAVLAPRYNIAPTQAVAVVRTGNQGARRELTLMRWGLIPSWAKDAGHGAPMINARAESLAEKPAFRSALAQRRCLVLASGFYEWKKTGTTKQPYYFRAHNDRPLAFAGLWESWGGKGNAPLLSCTIVTTGANAAVAPVHDRMPVILPHADHAAWLRPSPLTPGELERLLLPAPDDALAVRRVSLWVNSPAHDDPECVRPAT